MVRKIRRQEVRKAPLATTRLGRARKRRAMADDRSHRIEKKRDAKEMSLERKAEKATTVGNTPGKE